MASPDSPWVFGLACFTACVRKTRNVARGLTQRYGTQTIKKKLWDAEFSSGRWRCLENMPDDCVYAHVERYAHHGSILDLGCGPGTTGTELPADSYTRYTGVDISGVAVGKARKRAEESHRADKNRYLQGDIFSYVPTATHDVILFGDSLYYVPQRLILSMLKRYAPYLTEKGVFVARIYGRRYQKIVDIIENHFNVVEQHVYGIAGDEVFVIVFAA
jgi:SAM-dependent methyltransferase